MPTVVVIIVVVVIFLVLGIGILCTWSWWKRFLNRCLSDPPPVAEFERNFEQLDPSTLGRAPPGRRGHGASVTIEPLPSLSDLNADPRDSVRVRLTRFPKGLLPVGGESTIFAHDWFHPPFENFPRSNLEYISIFGKAGFGKVLESNAKDISPNMPVRKVIVRQLRDDATSEEQIRFLNQSRIFRDAKHDNVLKLFGFSVDSMPYLTILEFWPLGNLKEYLIKKDKAGESGNLLRTGVIARMAIDIAKAMDWINSTAGFVHDDLSARNCLVANVAGKVIVGDYGLGPTRFPKDYYRCSNYAIPIRWAAPETYNFVDDACTPFDITPESNIWTYGVVLREIYEFGRSPYSDMSDDEVISRVFVQKNYIMDPPSVPFVVGASRDMLYKLMLSCCKYNPEDRPSFRQILEVLTLSPSTTATSSQSQHQQPHSSKDVEELL